MRRLARSRYARGSSPQARGTLMRPTFSGLKLTVHPRRRGEHLSYCCTSGELCGSSPQARGTHYCLILIALNARFIPAGAGNTPRPRPPRCCQPVHPRRRGEHQPSVVIICDADGSSPQARGTLGTHPSDTSRERFIPAGAGNTAAAAPPGIKIAVHPRRRGEHSMV